MRVDLKVEGMTCEHCARTIERALQRVGGVTAAQVDYAGGRGSVDLAGEVPARQLVEAVEHAGYRARVLQPVTERASAARERGAWQMPQPLPSAGADYDLLVIGTGGAGVAAAIQAAGMGARVAITEGGALGGTCVNVGCIPSKNLIEAAAHYHAARRGFPGISPCEPAFDWGSVIGQKDALVRELRQAKYADVLASYPEIKLLEGRTRLLGDGRARVGEREVRAPKVIIATGTTPALPPVPGIESVEPLDSTTAMELRDLPRSLIVLGGSAVGLELGQTFARFGTKVIVLELMPRLLPNEDEQISEGLRGYLAEEGIEIHTGVKTTRIERDDDGVVVHVEEGSLSGEFRAERLLVAAGRRPNTREMGLEDAGVALDSKGFVQVDAAQRTSNPHVFAAGDVTGAPGFVYVAAAAGRVAAENALSGESRELDLSVVPAVTFTSPQVASVGLTEAKAREAGHTVEVSTLALEHVPRALVSHDRRGLVKLVAEAGSGKLLGMHVVATNAGELIGEGTLALRFGLTVRDLTTTLHPYLTWVEGVKLAAQGFATDVTRLSCCA